MVAWAVVASDTSAVEAKDDGKAMQRNVVHHLIPRAVQERGVQSNNRAHAAHGHACCGSDCVLLGNANVEETFGEFLLKVNEASGAWHCCGDCNNARIFFGKRNDAVGKSFRVTSWAGLWRAGNRVEHWRIMQVLFVVIFGGRISATFLRDHMNDDGAFFNTLLSG
ncbi:unannotated protein [freshwater metagenome]|uniref:Unannotated protein n=1 Tax=freshwater metagenome TaxID=449393 RepID=A0A6J6R3S5_9ZZZZ